MNGPVAQLVRAPPCHGGGREFESLLGRLLVTFSEQAINNYIWDHSSAGRASALQAEGHRFEPYCSHQYGPVAQLVRALACHARGQGFEPPSGRHFRKFPGDASVAQLVEQETENLRVVGSIPTGGTICGFSSFGRAPPCQGGGGGFEPRNPLHEPHIFMRLNL